MLGVSEFRLLFHTGDNVAAPCRRPARCPGAEANHQRDDEGGGGEEGAGEGAGVQPLARRQPHAQPAGERRQQHQQFPALKQF